MAPAVRFFMGDLRRGDGIDAAMSGVGTVVHCATSTKGDADATRILVTAAVQAGSQHLVYPSIVGN
jgi:nucleoside-diphosphate-sugar epimerase